MGPVIKTSTTILGEPLGLLGLGTNTIFGEIWMVDQLQSRSRDQSLVRTELADCLGLVTAQGELKAANSGTIINELHKRISWNFCCLVEWNKPTLKRTWWWWKEFTTGALFWLELELDAHRHREMYLMCSLLLSTDNFLDFYIRRVSSLYLTIKWNAKSIRSVI